MIAAKLPNKNCLIAIIETFHGHNRRVAGTTGASIETVRPGGADDGTRLQGGIRP
jgi:hypothetical protein